MNFNKHYDLEGKHAQLSASNYHWVNYSDAKLVETYTNVLAKERGVRLHAYACESILLQQKLPRTNQTLNMFVNDAIGFNMTPEQILYYSDFCFGTADAISFHKNKLRIHDLKTGKTKPSMMQLRIYAALFCLEYDINPFDIQIELRLYYMDERIMEIPEPEIIVEIINKIKASCTILMKVQEGVL